MCISCEVLGSSALENGRIAVDIAILRTDAKDESARLKIVVDVFADTATDDKVSGKAVDAVDRFNGRFGRVNSELTPKERDAYKTAYHDAFCNYLICAGGVNPRGNIVPRFFGSLRVDVQPRPGESEADCDKRIESEAAVVRAAVTDTVMIRFFPRSDAKTRAFAFNELTCCHYVAVKAGALLLDLIRNDPDAFISRYNEALEAELLEHCVYVTASATAQKIVSGGIGASVAEVMMAQLSKAGTTEESKRAYIAHLTPEQVEAVRAAMSPRIHGELAHLLYYSHVAEHRGVAELIREPPKRGKAHMNADITAALEAMKEDSQYAGALDSGGLAESIADLSIEPSAEPRVAVDDESIE